MTIKLRSLVKSSREYFASWREAWYMEHMGHAMTRSVDGYEETASGSVHSVDLPPAPNVYLFAARFV